MARAKIEPTVKTPEEQLIELIPKYAMNKNEMDSYKKLVDKDNLQIKDLMKQASLNEFIVSDFRAARTVAYRKNINEEAMIEKIKALGIRGIVKKREYIDTDALENAMYHGKVNPEKLADCIETKEVVTLKITRVKG